MIVPSIHHDKDPVSSASYGCFLSHRGASSYPLYLSKYVPIFHEININKPSSELGCYGGSWIFFGNPPKICLEKTPRSAPPEQTLEAAAPTNSVRTNCGSNLEKPRRGDCDGWMALDGWKTTGFFNGKKQHGIIMEKFQMFQYGKIIDFRRGFQLLGETSWKINEHHLFREDP